MNPSNNPYEPPIETAKSKTSTSISHAAGGLFAFFGIGFIVWLSTILMVFGDSSAYWPAFAALLPAVLVGLVGASFVYQSKSPFSISGALISTSALLVIMILGFIGSSELKPISLVPNKQFSVAPMHWVLLCFALSAAFFSGVNLVLCWKKTSFLGRLLPILLLTIGLSYLAYWSIGYSSIHR
jgi:hypothetical protein